MTPSVSGIGPCSTENEWKLGVAATIGVGYEIGLDDRSSLLVWVDFNFDLYDEFDVGDIEGTIEYAYALSDSFALALSFKPTVLVEDEPILYAGVSF
jgi:hypothetical protein